MPRVVGDVEGAGAGACCAVAGGGCGGADTAVWGACVGVCVMGVKRRRSVWFLVSAIVVCLIATSLLSACDNGPQPAATPMSTSALTPTILPTHRTPTSSPAPAIHAVGAAIGPTVPTLVVVSCSSTKERATPGHPKRGAGAPSQSEQRLRLRDVQESRRRRGEPVLLAHTASNFGYRAWDMPEPGARRSCQIGGIPIHCPPSPEQAASRVQ